MQYVIKNIDFSLTEEQSLSLEDQVSVIKCYVQAYSTYTYNGKDYSSACPIHLVATKETSPDGTITVTRNSEEFPSSEVVLNKVKAAIESGISTVIAEKTYYSLKIKSLSDAQELSGLPSEGSSTIEVVLP